MAHLEFSPVIHDTGLVLTKEEAKVLIRLLFFGRSRESRHIRRLQDIQDSGEATEKQQTQLMKHQEKERIIQTILVQAGKFVEIA